MNRTSWTPAAIALASTSILLCACAGEPPGADEAGGVETVQSPDPFAGPVMTVLVQTGPDDLRGIDSFWGGSPSYAMLSVVRSDGTLSSEKMFTMADGAGQFLDQNGQPTTAVGDASGNLPGGSRFRYLLGSPRDAGWDGFDPCAKGIRIRLVQGHCGGCSPDNWDLASFQVFFGDSLGSPQWQMVGVSGKRITAGNPIVTYPTVPPPAGEICLNGGAADCHGIPQSAAVISQWPTDAFCDDGQYGAFLNCSAFKFDSGRCGRPASWTCPASYYGTLDGCDCGCGAWDPDCDVAGQTLFECPGVTLQGMCLNLKVSLGNFAPACRAP